MSQFDTARHRHCEFRWRVGVHAAWLTRDSRRVSLPQQPEPVDADEDASRERQIIKAALAGSRGRLEYRRIGNPGGGWPGTLDDVRTGAAHLEKIAAERSLDLKRVVAMGTPREDTWCFWLAKQNAIALTGLVALAPVAELRRAWSSS